MPESEGPYVEALLCERVLEEKDGVKSIVRVIDRITRQSIGPTAPATLEPFEHPLTIFIKMAPGRARGTYGVQIHLVKPSEETVEVARSTVHFEGQEDRGADIVGTFGLKVDMAGLYWFEIYLEDQGKLDLMTRLPFRVIYLPRTTPGAVQNPPK